MRRGLADAREGAWTPEALLVAIAPTRLRELGLEALESRRRREGAASSPA